MAERPYPECRDCQCSEHNALTALAERRDAWKIANQLLTDAAKRWRRNPEGDGSAGTYEVDAADALILANWLYAGDTSVGT
jgi:hypothetical protein